MAYEFGCYHGLYCTPDHGKTHHAPQCGKSNTWIAYYGAWGLVTFWCDEHKPSPMKGVVIARIESAQEAKTGTNLCHSAHPDGEGGVCVSSLVCGQCHTCGFQVGDENPFAASR